MASTSAGSTVVDCAVVEVAHPADDASVVYSCRAEALRTSLWERCEGPLAELLRACGAGGGSVDGGRERAEDARGGGALACGGA